MEFRCKECGFDLAQMDLKIHLRAPQRSIFCPVCAQRVIETFELPGSFYDERDQTYVIWNPHQRRQAETQISKIFNKLEVTIEGKSVNPYDICYQKVIIFEHAGEVMLPRTGVRPEFFHYLRPDVPPAPGKWAAPKFAFEAALRGGLNVPMQLPAMISQTVPGSQLNRYKNGTALNIWPNFRRQGWRNYFVYFVSTDPNVRVRSLRVIGGGGNEEKNIVDSAPRGEICFVPAFIEISVTDAAGAEYSSCYEVEFGDGETVQAPAGGGDAGVPILSLDFGTSNTCFAGILPGDAEVRIINFRDRTKRLIKGLDVEDAISFMWFPEVEEGRPQNQLPSELNFPKEIDKLGSELKEFQPVVNYTIPPFTRYRDGEEKYVLGEFKWERAFSNSHLEPFTADLQYLYLTLVMRMALAELASDPRCQRFDRIDFVATCPLAFTTPQRGKFRDVISRVQRNIEQQAGIRLSLRKIYDESHAGEAGSGQMPGTTETIYVDVGGGTTDIGLFRFDEQGQEQAIFLDSMQYAGDDIWKAVTEGSLSGWAQIKLEREARSRTVKSIFDDSDLAPFRDQANNLHRASEGVQRFIGGLIEFITRMIAARERSRTADEQPPGELGLYLLGNGWRFIEVLDQAGGSADVGAAIAAGVKSMVEERLQKYGIKAPKLVVRYPILNNLTPKTAVVIGAATLYYGELMLGRVPPEPEFTMRSFLGGDAVITSVGKHVIEWHVPVPHALTANSGVRSINYKPPSSFDFESAQVGDTRVESVNLLVPVIMKLNGQPFLGKNLFAYYLEQWQTKLLINRPSV